MLVWFVSMCSSSVSMFGWMNVANRSHALQRSRSHVYCSSLSVWGTDVERRRTDKQNKKEIAATVLWSTGRDTVADPAVPLLVHKPNGFASLWSDSAKLVIIGLHQGFLLFLVVTGLITGAVVTLRLITSFTDLLRLHVPVDWLLEVRLIFFREKLWNLINQRCSSLFTVHFVHVFCCAFLKLFHTSSPFPAHPGPQVFFLSSDWSC